jgi:hypothetical protein
MVQPTQRRITKPIPSLQHLFVFVLFLAGIIAFAVWFSLVPTHPSSIVSEPRLELSLSGAIGTNLVLTGEDVAKTLSCTNAGIRFAMPPTNGLYGLTWAFALPEGLNLPSIFTLSSTYPLTLSLVSQTGAYRTFTATEGEFYFSPGSKRGHFTAFLYDEDGERVFASASWQCE